MDLTSLAQLWIASFLREGDLAIDATVGNGHDTLFLARQVGASGRVIGFDIQEIALDVARQRLESAGFIERVQLVRRSHSEMQAVLSLAPGNRQPRAIMFNLGYLPGADKAVTTETEQTLTAVAAAADLLAPGGGMSIVLYPGHAEGERETAAVSEWAAQLVGPFEVTLSRPLNRSGKAPCLVAVEKRVLRGSFG